MTERDWRPGHTLNIDLLLEQLLMRVMEINVADLAELLADPLNLRWIVTTSYVRHRIDHVCCRLSRCRHRGLHLIDDLRIMWVRDQ